MPDSAEADGDHRPTVVFLPDKRLFNPYQTRLAEALSSQGFNVVVKDHPPLLGAFCRQQRLYENNVIVHLHWLNGLTDKAVYAQSGIRFLIWYVLVTIDLTIFRLRGGKLFWTVHNLISHECPNPSREMEMRRLVARLADGIHFHSQSAVTRAQEEYTIRLRHKAVVAAHAGYPDDYPPDSSRTESMALETGIRSDHFTFLFFGTIRSYKGLESLVEAFSRRPGPRYRLLIAGAAIPGVSIQWLDQASARDPRVLVRSGYVSNLDVSALFAISDVLVAPYSATLTSGVVSLGLTFGIPMVLPDAAKVYDLPGDAGAEFFAPGNLPEALAMIETRNLALMRAHNTTLGQSLTWGSMAETIAMAYRKALPAR
ncbi:glycosyltransferase [Synechococcus sp. CS-1332]|uniref:glycosyltransferase n=1 Tax=Synechococcus sp. CS-1332 TaxID=2847972 RepID=UPI00223BE7FE|nr:glycosyltransferase [Synechococcus sp. CS-1332]MCT0208439.1 glycosyltransferase [Synechococcus sp. CS-1332]